MGLIDYHFDPKKIVYHKNDQKVYVWLVTNFVSWFVRIRFFISLKVCWEDAANVKIWTFDSMEIIVDGRGFGIWFSV